MSEDDYQHAKTFLKMLRRQALVEEHYPSLSNIQNVNYCLGELYRENKRLKAKALEF